MFALLGIVLPTLSLATAPADQKSEWKYYKDITIADSPAKGELVKVILDQEVFGASNKDLGDLRITDVTGTDVPYKLIVERDVFSEENIYPVRVLNNSYSAQNGYNVFIIDFGQGGMLNSSFKIVTSSENFKRTVEVSGGDDMASWNVLKRNGYVYDYTDRAGNFKAQNTSVDYPENAYRYIQVKIFAGGEAPLIVSGAQVSRITKKEKKEIVLNPAYETNENSDKRTTEVIVDLEKNGWPTSGVVMVSPDENFNREVLVYESDNKADWQSVGQGYIFNYDTPKFVGDNLDINYSETSKQYLKIEIFNGDNRPISISDLSTKTVLRSIVFQYGIGTTGDAYRLYYGNPAADFPDYDLEKFFPYLDTGKYFGSALFAQTANASYREKVPPVPPLSERIPWLVPGALILAIVMMGLIVVRFMKKVGAGK
jgi:hypothetical protein